jgi:hypothetical protein
MVYWFDFKGLELGIAEETSKLPTSINNKKMELSKANFQKPLSYI